jgi:hypothetical protein
MYKRFVKLLTIHCTHLFSADCTECVLPKVISLMRETVPSSTAAQTSGTTASTSSTPFSALPVLSSMTATVSTV